MIFNLISDDETRHRSNPLVKHIYSNVEKFDPGEVYVIDSYDKALEIFPNASFFQNQIKSNISWTEDIAEFSQKYLTSLREQYQTKVLISNTFNISAISYQNDQIVTYLLGDSLYILDKRISAYFGSKPSNEGINYDNHFRLLLKQAGFITDTYRLENLESYLKKIFQDDFWAYILIIFNIIKDLPQKYIAEYEFEGEKKNAWEELFKVEKYLNQVRIYGLDSYTLDLEYQRDTKGRFFVQYTYSGAESVTGRIYTKPVEGYQGLQNLPADQRSVLKAEPGCCLLEIDYNSFEYVILAGIIDYKFEGDPHQEIADYIFPDQGITRAVGKRINYSAIYGINITNLAKNLAEEHPGSEVAEIEEKLRSHPFFQQVEAFKLVLQNNNFDLDKMLLRNYFNRVIRIEKKWALVNNFIQSTAADYLYLKFNKIVELLSPYNRKNRILMQNHDSILFQIQDKVIEETDVIEQIQGILAKPYKKIKAQYDMKVGRNWGEID